MNHWRANIFLVLVLFLASMPTGKLHGASVDAVQAQTAVSGWLRIGQTHLQTSMGRPSENVTTFADAFGTPLYHVVDLNPEGFVIVAADDLVEPIIGFSTNGRFDPSPANPLCALASRDLSNRIARAKSTKALSSLSAKPAPNATQVKWAMLQSTAQTNLPTPLHIASVSDLRVAPLLQTLWDQQTSDDLNACYNYYTPPYAEGTSSNFPAGCVATAMAQVMRYWQYPVNSVGTPTFSITILTSTGYVFQTQSLRGGDGQGGPYDWADMITKPSWGSTLVQRQAIGALCADVGVALNMAYRSTGSGAWMSGPTFVNTFGYSNAIRGHTTNDLMMTIPQLCAMLNPNLDAGCPVMLGIMDDGHAIACDGYGYDLGTLYHHMNYGWSGNFNAWYTVTPSGDAGCAYVDECVFNIWTNGTGEIVSGRIFNGADGCPITGAVVTATCAGGTYTATSGTNGIYALTKIPSSATYTVSVSKAGYTFTNQVVTTGLSIDKSGAAANGVFDIGNFWGFDFISTGWPATDPAIFVASPVSRTCIALSWTPDNSGDPVMVAWNTNAIFGIPAGVCSPGDAISGGGTVLCNGTDTNISHAGLTALTTYYYQAWSVRDGTNYSLGVTNSATTIGRYVPLNFRATAVNSSTIKLTWTQNASNDNVMVAWNAGPSFGTPTNACAIGDSIPGGGGVLYSGSATNILHTDLASLHPYYYQAWSVCDGTNYSLGVPCSATTSNRTVLPFTEGFEGGIPAAWPQVFVVGSVGWVAYGFGSHGGTYNANLYYPSCITTRLITPPFDFGTGARNAQLSFWHKMPVLGTNQDNLSVLYKTNAGGAYTLLATYTNNVPVWTNRILALPNPNGSYYIAFEGNANGGYGVYLDDVAITATYPSSNSFTVWTQVHCPGMNITNFFNQVCDNNGVANGFEYAFGTNWSPGAPLINIRFVDGAPVVEIPKQDPNAVPFVCVAVQTTTNLYAPVVWNTNNFQIIDSADKPANCNWLQPAALGSNGFFRVQGVLLE